LSGENSDASKFAEHCQKALVAPEMERDLLQVEDSALAEAASFHLASMSAFRLLGVFASFGFTSLCLGRDFLFCAGYGAE
jgi:hypothetical protein